MVHVFVILWKQYTHCTSIIMNDLLSGFTHLGTIDEKVLCKAHASDSFIPSIYGEHLSFMTFYIWFPNTVKRLWKDISYNQPFTQYLKAHIAFSYSIQRSINLWKWFYHILQCSGTTVKQLYIQCVIQFFPQRVLQHSSHSAGWH